MNDSEVFKKRKRGRQRKKRMRWRSSRKRKDDMRKSNKITRKRVKVRKTWKEIKKWKGKERNTEFLLSIFTGIISDVSVKE